VETDRVALLKATPSVIQAAAPLMQHGDKLAIHLGDLDLTFARGEEASPTPSGDIVAAQAKPPVVSSAVSNNSPQSSQIVPLPQQVQGDTMGRVQAALKIVEQSVFILMGLVVIYRIIARKPLTPSLPAIMTWLQKSLG
jgi:hypothetical protein